MVYDKVRKATIQTGALWSPSVDDAKRAMGTVQRVGKEAKNVLRGWVRIYAVVLRNSMLWTWRQKKQWHFAFDDNARPPVPQRSPVDIPNTTVKDWEAVHGVCRGQGVYLRRQFQSSRRMW